MAGRGNRGTPPPLRYIAANLTCNFVFLIVQDKQDKMHVSRGGQGGKVAMCPQPCKNKHDLEGGRRDFMFLSPPSPCRWICYRVSHNFNSEFSCKVHMIKELIVLHGLPSDFDIHTGDGETQQLLNAKLQIQHCVTVVMNI